MTHPTRFIRTMAALFVLLALCAPATSAQEPRKENSPLAEADLSSDGLKNGQAYVVNQWGLDIYQVTLRHRRGNDIDHQETQSWYNLSVGEVSTPMNFTYETGAGSPRDYWWVTFTLVGSNQAWCTKNNFYCSVSSDDNGQVTLTLYGDTNTMVVSFSSSSSCSVAVNKC